VIGSAADGWHPTTREHIDRGEEFRYGNHGYDPAYRSMHGLFIATGPQFKTSMKAPAFSNLHVYDLICSLLGIKPAANAGDPRVTEAFLAEPLRVR
jgi:hypothetical protein